MTQQVRYLIILCFSLLVIITSGCGFHLRGKVEVPSQLQTILLENNDPFGPLNRAIINELHNNGVIISEDKTRTDIPVLRINGIKQSEDTVSIFADGNTAEYQLTMLVNAQVLIPNKGLHSLDIRVNRSFFDNPLTVMAKDAERNMIDTEMREAAARQMVRKLLTINIDNLESTLIDDVGRHEPSQQSVKSHSDDLPPIIINNEYILPGTSNN